MSNKQEAALDLDYREKVEEFIEETTKDTSRLSAIVENINSRLDEQKEDMEKMDGKLDKIIDNVSSTMRSADAIHANHENRLLNIEKEKQEEKENKKQEINSRLILWSAILSPVIGGIIEMIVHFMSRVH